MAYDVTEERLKVKGSEQITRDLKVNRDAFINGKAETGSIDDKGDLKVAGEILAGDDVTISGDLYVNGTEYINDSETAQTTDNYLVLRHNQTTPLGTDEYSGVAVHNYASGKTATITTDKDGTWRVADNTETDTNYTNISYYNGVYYTELTRTAATVISGIKTAFDEDELDECVYYDNSYYHFDGNNWFPVSLVDNKLTLGSAITDSTIIAALNALTKEDLVYFRTLTITVINPVENQPLLTRAESSDLTGGQALTWDATNQKAIGKTIDTTVTADSSNLITSGAVKTAIDTAEANAKCLDNATGVLDITHGGTGATCAADARACLGLGDISTINANNCTIEFLRGDGTWALPSSVASCADCGKNGNDYCAFGTNAFNSTAFTTCTGTVTVANVASNTSYPIALCTGATAIGRSISHMICYNPFQGVLCVCGYICAQNDIYSYCLLAQCNAKVCGSVYVCNSVYADCDAVICGAVYAQNLYGLGYIQTPLASFAGSCPLQIRTLSRLGNTTICNNFAFCGSYFCGPGFKFDGSTLHLKSGASICYDL